MQRRAGNNAFCCFAFSGGKEGITVKRLFRRRRLRGEDGQALLEFALVLPIFLLILCGILDFGWLFYNQLALNNICREGARYAVVNTAPNHTTDGILHHIQNYMEDTYTLGDVDVTVTYSQPLDPISGDVTVAVVEDFHFLTPLVSTVIGTDERQLTAQVIMKVES